MMQSPSSKTRPTMAQPKEHMEEIKPLSSVGKLMVKCTKSSENIQCHPSSGWTEQETYFSLDDQQGVYVVNYSLYIYTNMHTHI